MGERILLCKDRIPAAGFGCIGNSFADPVCRYSFYDRGINGDPIRKYNAKEVDDTEKNGTPSGHGGLTVSDDRAVYPILYRAGAYQRRPWRDHHWNQCICGNPDFEPAFPAGETHYAQDHRKHRRISRRDPHQCGRWFFGGRQFPEGGSACFFVYILLCIFIGFYEEICSNL